MNSGRLLIIIATGSRPFVPPMEGFHLLAWTMPYVFAGLGLGVIVWYVRRQMKKRPAPLPEVDPAVLDSIDKDLAKLD